MEFKSQKRCSICFVYKDLAEFNKNKCKYDGLQTFCRECSKHRSRRYYKDNVEKHRRVVTTRKSKLLAINRTKFLEYLKDKCCVDCAESDPIVLEFDHVRGQKENGISQLLSGGASWDTIYNEILKCEIRCANCHRRRTALTRNYFKIKT